MERDTEKRHKNLPRLHAGAYKGLATVHWILNIKDRKKGWLDEAFFLKFQIAAVHSFSRYQLVSPCICLMPDHIHMLVMGISKQSNQRQAIPFLRTHLKEAIDPFEFQRPSYDHVLRKDERTREAFAKMAGYILENPKRGGLLENEAEWPFTCSIVPGFPDLKVSDEDFWDRFWRIYNNLIERHEE